MKRQMYYVHLRSTSPEETRTIKIWANDKEEAKKLALVGIAKEFPDRAWEVHVNTVEEEKLATKHET